MPTFVCGDFICHSNAPPPRKNLYTAPMIKMKPNDRSGFTLNAIGNYQRKNFKYRSFAEVNSILIGNGYMLTGEETKQGKHIRFYSKIRPL